MAVPDRLWGLPPMTGNNDTVAGFTKSGVYAHSCLKGSQFDLQLATPQNGVWGAPVTAKTMWECVIIQRSNLAPANKLEAEGTPLFWVCPDIREGALEEFCGRIIGAPTDLVSMMKQGFRFQMRDGRAPIEADPILSYDFTDKNCFNPARGFGFNNTVFDLSGNGLDGDLNDLSNVGTWGGIDSTGGTALDMTDGNTWINIPGNLRTSVKNAITYSVLAQRNGGGAQYLWDARNCSGTWMLTEYSGYDFNNGNSLRFNTSPINGYQKKFHYLQTSGGGAGKAWYNSTDTTPGITGGQPSGPQGNNFRIATRYTNSSRWNGLGMSGFWIYDGLISDADAGIVNYHNYYYFRTFN